MYKSNLEDFLRILLLFLVIIAFTGCNEGKIEEVKKEATPVRVITGEASVRRVEYTLEQVGTMEASQQVTVRTEIEGRIVELLFNEGREVSKGAVLVRIDSTKTEANIRSLEAQIKQLKIRLDNKIRTLERNLPLVKEGLIPLAQFDNLQTEIDELKAQIIQAQANLARERVRLDEATIRAPFSGVVGARNLSPGDYLKPGDPVVVLLDMDTLEIRFQVPEKYKLKISLGQEVKLAVSPYPDRSFRGVVSFLSPQSDINTRTFQVKARVDNRERLLNPGMFARVEVVTDVIEKAVTLPWESIIQTEDGTYFYMIEEGLARKVPVKLGRTTNEWAEIRHPEITPGTKVILEGKFTVRDGMKVSFDGLSGQSTGGK